MFPKAKLTLKTLEVIISEKGKQGIRSLPTAPLWVRVFTSLPTEHVEFLFRNVRKSCCTGDLNQLLKSSRS